ncbi:hypothetical protein FOYG_05117 [Fusarium oxysporum NRRL 32931]|uniref:Uncharacterized protein n=1 Tax=Fusarium oxysporum NRRL 32931 TaxID=660029 RepID=W9IV86_FUSOX|nr:hypothetical protein FOYG_05117 [Fusarium oxysporum NRRL 32931]
MMWMAESYYGSTRNIDAKEGIKFLPTSRNMFFRGAILVLGSMARHEDIVDK